MERESYKEAAHKAEILTTALPYIRDFNHKVAVIEYGCRDYMSPMDEQELMRDIVLLKIVGMKPIVVHDTPLGVDRFRENKRIAKLLELCGTRAIGICGIDPKTLHMTLDHSYIPVIVPNDINNEEEEIDPKDAALKVAALLGADKLIYLSSYPGIWRNEEHTEVYSRLTLNEIQSLMEERKITKGVMSLVERGIEAINGGVSRVHILDGCIRHALLLEFFSVAGVGTILIRDEGKLYEHEKEME